MKKIFIIAFLFFISGNSLFAQESDNNGNDKIRDKMTEFIQRRMNLTKNEAERFAPVFLRYFRDWRDAIQQNRGDRLILQQKIIELRLRYREDFKVILGESRSNDIYKQQDIFMKELRTLKEERIESRANRRFRSIIQ